MAQSRYIFKRTGEVLDRGTGERICYVKRDATLDFYGNEVTVPNGDWNASFDPTLPPDNSYWGTTREEAVNSLLYNHEKATKTGRFAPVTKN